MTGMVISASVSRDTASKGRSLNDANLHLKMAVCPLSAQVLLPKGEHLNNDVSAKVCITHTHTMAGEKDHGIPTLM